MITIFWIARKPRGKGVDGNRRSNAVSARSCAPRSVVLTGLEWTYPTFPICGRPRPRKVFLQCFDQIACVHMSGLFVRSHMNAGQDSFVQESSKQMSDLIEGHWGMRNFSRHGSIDHMWTAPSSQGVFAVL